MDNNTSLNSLAGEQLISIKAEVAQVFGVKTIHTLHQGILKRQEVLIRDTTSTTTLILWESYVDTLDAGKTYLLKNLKLKVSRNERYLNTAKDEVFHYAEEPPFIQPLIEVESDVVSQFASSTITK